MAIDEWPGGRSGLTGMPMCHAPDPVEGGAMTTTHTSTTSLRTTSGAPAPTSPVPTPDTVSVRSLERAGGTAALVTAATYVTGFAVMGAYLAPRGFVDAQGDPAASLRVLTENAGVMYGWNLVLYLVGGLALMGLTLALRDRLGAAPHLARAAAILGSVWAGLLLASGMVALVGQTTVLDLAATDHAMAVATWSSVSVVQDAMGGGVELVGGAWALLVGVAGWRTRALSRGLSAVAVGIGVLGTATLVPQVAAAAAAAFGIALIGWFVWVGVALLRGTREPTA
jgi:hypothetical protein